MRDQSYIIRIAYFEEYCLLGCDVESSKMSDELSFSNFKAQYGDNTFSEQSRNVY
jgi:hypothetical protein